MGQSRRAARLPFCFVIVIRIEVDGAKEADDCLPLVAADVLVKCGGDGGFLGLVAAEFAGCFDQFVEIGHGAFLVTLCTIFLEAGWVEKLRTAPVPPPALGSFTSFRMTL
jgi:hypothetical protein